MASLAACKAAGYDFNYKQQYETPLVIAGREGHIDAASFLLECKADLELRNGQGHTALVMAAKYGHKDMCELLLKAGAKPDYVIPSTGNVSCFVGLC